MKANKLLLTLLACVTGIAYAGTSTAILTITGTLPAVCNISLSSATLNFALSATTAPTPQTTLLNFSCNNPAPVYITAASAKTPAYSLDNLAVGAVGNVAYTVTASALQKQGGGAGTGWTLTTSNISSSTPTTHIIDGSGTYYYGNMQTTLTIAPGIASSNGLSTGVSLVAGSYQDTVTFTLVY